MRLAVIPARGGSSRIKDKNVTDFCGRPMIAYPLEAARASGLFDTIHVSTDSERYAEIARTLGGEVEFLRDPELSKNQVGMVDVLRWVVSEFKKRGHVFDEVCLVFATAVLIDAADLKRGHALFVKKGRSLPVLAVTTFPAPVQRALTVGASGALEPLFPETWPRHSQDLSPAYHDAGAFFLIGTDQLMADERDIYSEFLPLVLPRNKAVDIDEPEDMEIAEILYLGNEAKRTRERR